MKWLHILLFYTKVAFTYVGNKCLLNYDETWESLIDYCDEHKTVVPEKQFPSRSDIERLKGFSVKK